MPEPFFFAAAAIIALALGALFVSQRNATRESPWLAIAALLLIFTAGAVGLYQGLGAPHVINLEKKRDMERAEWQKQIRKLDAKLTDTPADGPHMLEMGRLYVLLGDYEEAENTLMEASRRSRGAPDIMLALSKVIVLRADGRVTPDALTGFRYVLDKDPINLEALFFTGVERMQAGDTERAKNIFVQVFASPRGGWAEVQALALRNFKALEAKETGASDRN